MRETAAPSKGACGSPDVFAKASQVAGKFGAPIRPTVVDPFQVNRAGTVGDKFDKLVEVGKLAEQHQYEELRQSYSADVRGWSPSYDFEGIESWLVLLAEQNDPFSDIETLNHLVAETDDAVVNEWTWAATHTETGKPLSMKGLSVFEFSDGKIASFRQYFDMAAVMAQFA